LSAISRNRGFTLLEILIALILLSVLSAALYGSYFGVVRARESATDGMESRRELGATLDLIRREVASAMFIRSDTRLRFVVEDRDNFGIPASVLELATLAPPSTMERRESGIVKVRYRLIEKDNTRTLTRQEQDLFYDGANIPAYPQMERIRSFLVECQDGTKWVKNWDTAINGVLPKAVRVTVQVDDQGKLAEFVMLSVPKVSGR